MKKRKFILILAAILIIGIVTGILPVNKIFNISSQAKTDGVTIIERKNSQTIIVPHYLSNDNHYLVRTTESLLLNLYTRSYDTLFVNDISQSISYIVMPLHTKPSATIIVGVVNDESIQSLYYNDHVGANGIISFLTSAQSLNNSGLEYIQQHPQLFVIKTPFLNGNLIGKNSEGEIIFEEQIRRD